MGAFVRFDTMGRRGVTAGAAVLVLLAACTGGAGEPGPEPSGEASTPAPVDTSAVAATTTLHLAGAEVAVDVLPIVRVGEHVVLTMDLAMEDTGGDDAFLSSVFSGVPVLTLPALSGLRLLDLDRDVVHTVAQDADGRAVTTGQDFIALGPGTTMRLQTAYAAPPEDVTSLGVFVPGGPYLPGVAVVDGEVPSPELPASAPTDADGDPAASPAPVEEVEPLDLDTVAEAPVLGLESFTAELAGAVQTLTTTDEVQVTLGSDVLFAVDSADLTEVAQAALDAAANHLASREPGTVSVVGHTDDVASDAYNQDLSLRRAQAVAAALAERIDTTAFTLEVEGRGESEPLVPGTDEASRAANRRVALTLTSQTTRTVEVTTDGELPPFDKGPVGTGAEGVLVEDLGTYRIRAPQARRVDGHVVLDLEISPVDEGAEDGVAFLAGVWHYRGDAYSVQRSASGVVMLRGSTAVYPMDYLDAVSADGHEQWLPATDLETNGTLAPGATRTFSIIYPDVGELDEIAVQVGGGLGQRAFRLTDIPVR